MKLGMDNFLTIGLCLFFSTWAFAQDPKAAGDSVLAKLSRDNMSAATRAVLPEQIVEILGSDGGRHSNAGKCIALSPNQKMVASGSRDETVRLWNSETLEEIRRFPHPDDVDAVYFDNESSHLLTECWDGYVRVFDLSSDSNSPACKIQVSRGRFKSTFHRQKNLLYITKGDSREKRNESMSILEYEWKGPSVEATGRVIHGLITLNETPPALTISPNGLWLCAAIEEFGATLGKVTLWNLSDRDPKAKQVQIFENESVKAVRFDAAGARLIAGGAQGSLVVRDLTSDAKSALLRDHKGDIETIQLSPDELQLFTGGNDQTIRVYDWRGGEPKFLETLHGHTEWVQGICHSSDNSKMFSIGWEGVIRHWNRKDNKWLAAPILGHQNAVCSIAFSADCQWIATGSTVNIGPLDISNEVFLWKLNGVRFEIDRKLSGTVGYIRSLSFSSDGKLLVAAHDKGLVGWDLTNGDRVMNFEREVVEDGEKDKATGQFVKFLSDSHLVISGWNHGLVAVVDFGSERPKEISSWKAPFYYIENIAVSTNGKQAFVSSIPLRISANELKVSEPSEELHEKEKQSQAGPETVGEYLLYRPVKQTFERVALCHENRILVGTEKSGKLMVFDSKSDKPELPAVIRNHRTRVEGIDFGKNGVMASGDMDGVVHLWNFSKGNSPLLKLKLERIWSLAFAPDGRHVAIGCGNGLIYILRVD